MGKRVAVVGSGLAGLASTVWLAELGYHVILVESNGSLGGRTIGLTSGHGDAIENGQHVLAGSYDCIFRYLDSVGTRHLLEFPDEFGVRYPGGHVETFGFKSRNVRRMLLGRVRGLGMPALVKAAPAWARLMRDVVRFDDALDDITVDEWLDRTGFPAPVRRIMLNSMVIGLLNELPQLASAHAFAALLRTGADRVRRSGRDAMRIGYPTVDLETLYLDGARRVMAERGVDVRLRTRAVAVTVDQDRATGVRLSDDSRIDADAVVLAVPSWNLRSLLDDVPGSEDARLAAKQLEPIPIMNAYVLLDRPLGTVAPWESLLDSDIGWVFDRDRMHGPRPDGNHLYALTTCAAYDLMPLKNREVADRLVAALKASYPAARDAGSSTSLWCPGPRRRSHRASACPRSVPATSPHCPTSPWPVTGPTTTGLPPWRAPPRVRPGPSSWSTGRSSRPRRRDRRRHRSDRPPTRPAGNQVTTELGSGVVLGDNNIRIEIAGLRGVPETALSAALVATLPANEAPAPWECHCSALLWLGRGGRAAKAALPPALAGSPALATMGAFVRYTDTPVGAYDEVLGMVGSRSGLRPWGNVAFMSVDSQSSLVGGRTNWAMPKTLAQFDGELANGRLITGSSDHPSWSVRATPRILGPAIPLKAKGRARQQFADGRVGSSLLTFAGRIRLAFVTVGVTSAGPLPTWLRSGLHLGAYVEDATFSLGEAEF